MARRHSIRLAFLAVAAALAIGAACADVVTVTPSNMQGWVLNNVTSAVSSLQDPMPPGGGMNSGGLFLMLGGGGSCTTCGYCGQTWMGTNQYSGTPLSQVESLGYDGWCSNSGIAKQQTWSPPRQPVGLRLVINTNNPNDLTPIRMLIFRPINMVGASQPAYGFSPYPEDFNFLNRWISWDCLYGASSCWAEFTYNAPTPPGCLWTGSWWDVKNLYPDATIATPDLQVGGQWPEASPVNTPNGCGLSLQWGAETEAGGTWPVQPWNNWWREGFNGVGFADRVTVGVSGTETIYDFEADSNRPAVCMNGKSYQHRIMSGAFQYWPFVVYGRAETGTITNAKNDGDHFYLQDGNGQQIEVVCMQHSAVPVTVGNYYRVRGKALRRFGMQPNGQPVPMRIHTDAFTALVTEIPEP